MDRKVVTCKWVFKPKINENGTIQHFKAHLVARGFTQVYGLDYWDTFASVAKLVSLRILLAIAAFEDLEIHQMDVVLAFLAGNIDGDVYMEQPEGFVHGDTSQVCKLYRSLYGLKQAPRIWNERINSFLYSIGFTQLGSDPCVYADDTGIIIALWVDDLFIFGGDIHAIKALKRILHDEFEMKDLCELQFFLRIRVTHDQA